MKNPRRTLAVLLLFGLGAAQWLHAEPFAYIPNGGRVSVIDVGSHRVLTEITVPGGLQEGVAARPGDSRVYVAAGQRVYALDSRAQAPVASIPEFAADLVALNPARPEAYVVNAPDLELLPGDRLVAINTDTKTSGGTVSAGVQPRRMAVSADGSRLYALYAQQLLVIDTSSRSVLKTLSTPLAESFVLHPSLNRAFVSVWASATAGAKVNVIDLDTGNVLSSIPTPSNPLDLVTDPTGTRLFVTYFNGNTVSVVDVPSASIVATLPVGAGTAGIDITPEGSQVFVVNNADASVSVIDAIGLRVTDTVRLGGGPRAIGRFIGGINGPIYPDVLTGLWYNPAQPGWGVHVAHRGNHISAAWFTYSASGAPKWYFSSDCGMNSQLPNTPGTGEASCTGNVYETTGPRFFSDPFNPGAVAINKVGLFQMTFQDKDHGGMSVVASDAAKSFVLQRQVFRTSGPAYATDYTDLWWNPLESGWGMGITQQFGVMFLAWFAYDDTGTAVWYVASNCVVNASGNGCSGELYRMSGPPDPLRNSFDVSRVKPATVGNITVTFSDPNTGTVNYTVDGKPGSKNITRQLF